MPRKPPPEWKQPDPVMSLRCPNCGHVIHYRRVFIGRVRSWVLKGRGWRTKPIDYGAVADGTPAEPHGYGRE